MRKVNFCIVYLALTLALCPTRDVPAASQSDSSALAKHLVGKVGVTHGLCSILGCGDGTLALEIARSSDLIVHVREPVSAAVAGARDVCDVDGLYGKRLIIEQGPLDHLSHADNTVDLVIAPSLTGSKLAQLSLSDILRVLRPGGKAILGRLKEATGSKNELTSQRLEQWLREGGVQGFGVSEEDFGLWATVEKPFPAGMDSWSHWQHGPDNNPVSTDTVIKAPYRTQWLGKPYYVSIPVVTTASGGRIFVATGHIAYHTREEPWLNTLSARNGYNGIELWLRKLPDGYFVHRSAFIATENVFYMIDGDGCLMLDPETGEEMGRISIPGVDGEWKWMALENGVLFVLAGGEKEPRGSTTVRSPGTHWRWEGLDSGYFQRIAPWCFGRTIVAYDLSRKKMVWRHDESKPIDSRAMVLGGDKVFYHSAGVHLGYLDAKTGTVLWTNSDQKTIALIEEEGVGLESTLGFKTMCSSLYTPDALVFEAQARMNVVAVSTKDGSLLWSRKKTTNNPNMLYLDGHIMVGIGAAGSTLALDPLTGATVEDLGLKKKFCARLTATGDSLFCRAWSEGFARYDRTSKRAFFNGAVRPGCNDGVISANGLLYIGPWLCDCNLSLMGTVALCSAGDFEIDHEGQIEQRREVGDGDISHVQSFDVTDKDWFTYRGNHTHSAWSNVAVRKDLRERWAYAEKEPFTPSTPSAAGGLVFSCGDDGKVRAIDAETGKVRWCFRTAGPIMRPPTVWNGRAYVGSGDGYIYALEAATGRLLWRFRAAPVDRRLMVYGSLCSNWPVNSGILVHDNVAYAVGGIIDYDGTYVCALDAVTGELKWRNDSSGHLDKELRNGVSAQGNLAIAGGRLWLAGGNVISPAAYDLNTGECLTRSVGNGGARSNRGEEVGVIKEKYLIFGGRSLYSPVENHVSPSYFQVSLIDPTGSGAPVLIGMGKIPPAWSSEMVVFVTGLNTVPVCASMETFENHIRKYGPEGAVAQYRTLNQLKTASLWVANVLKGTDTVSLAIASNEVLAVYEVPNPASSSQWLVAGLDPKRGTIVWKRELPCRALPGGLLVTRDGQVVVTLENGGTVCFG